MATTKSQFLMLGLGDKARVGGNVRVLGTAADETDAVTTLDELDPPSSGTSR